MTSEADKQDEVEEEEFEEYEYEVGSSLSEWLIHELWETLNLKIWNIVIVGASLLADLSNWNQTATFLFFWVFFFRLTACPHQTLERVD